MPSGSGDDINLSEFQLGVAKPDVAPRSMEGMPISDDDVLLDDMSLPGGPQGGSSSTIIGMKPAGKRPSDSDVTLVPDKAQQKGASDSDVRLASPPGRAKFPSDSDVTLVHDTHSIAGSSDDALVGDEQDDPNATTLRKSPLLGSSDEIQATAHDQSGSDFELTPSSVIDALQPESGSDFELTALDASDEFDAVPDRKAPSDSDVTGVEPSSSGINLGRPSDSGINLSSVGGFDFGAADSIELAPLDEDIPDPRAKPRAPAKPAAKKADASSETALPIKGSALDPSATALPMKNKGEKDIFDDTDFEVDAMDSSSDDRTVQLEAASDFDIDDSESGSEVFALDEDEVDENAATAMRPAGDDDDEFGAEGVSGETDSAWGDVEAEETPSRVAATAAPVASGRASASPTMSRTEATPEWGGLWVGLLGAATFFMILLAFVSMDLVSNLYENRGSTNPISAGLINTLSGLAGGK